MAESQPRRIVVTGTTRGLGLAMAEGFAARGHQVAGCGRDARQVEALRARLGAPHDFRVVDVANDPAVRDWAAQVLERFGPPELLVNNAALINANAPLWKVPAAEFDGLVDVNVKGVANVLRHFVPAMIARGTGVIVNLSSGWGRSTAPDVATYCATKWAVEGLTRALAQELPKGLAAVPLNPGIIDTDMLRSCFGGDADQYPGPREWAESAIPFLLALGRKDNGKPLTVPSP